MGQKIATRGRETWLDGLRGVAAAIVALFHYTKGEFNMPWRSFWDEPAEENRRLIQLPPFRLLFAGDAMVSLFFVISGYSISIAIVKLRQQEHNSNFYRKLTSSVFRRGLRLYIPVLIISVISHSLFYVGAYDWHFSASEGCPEAQPWSAIWPHFKCFTMTFFTTLDLGAAYSTLGLNANLWTIPVEFKGSMTIYLTIMGLAFVKSNIRLVIIALLGLQFLWFGLAFQFGFLAGLFLAELDAWRQQALYSMPAVTSIKPPNAKQVCWIKPATVVLFISGIYLMCLPYQDPLTTDYWFQSRLTLPFWVGTFIRINCWHSIGAAMVVGSLRNLPSTRAPLESAFAQFLAKISFSLYLLHLTFFRIFRNHILEAVCQLLWGKDLWSTANDENASYVILLAWFAATAIIGPMLVLSSNYLAKLVDQKSISWAYQLEKMLSTH